MSLQQWLDNSWIIKTERSAQEVSNLLGLAKRELADAGLEGISSDGKFDHAYAAVRTLAQLALHAAGYRVPKGVDQHVKILESLKFTLGGTWVEEADFFDQCRRLRHKSLYERSGVAQPKDADELLSAAERLHTAAREWLGQEHSDLAVD